MGRIILGVLMGLALAGSAAAETFKGQDYAEARKALIADGWKPAPAEGAASEKCFGQEEICEAYPEIESCAGTGAAPCLMNFRRGSEELAVTTEGEGLGGMVIAAP